MKTEGTLIKMKTALHDVVHYTLQTGGEAIDMNAAIGREITLHFTGGIYCISCGAKTKKSFGQGFCYKCFITKPEADQCIVKPELCQAHLGISRDMEWSKDHCLQDHFVYLAVSSGLKVGVTRSTQIPTRWMDQGAWKAIKLARTPYRELAGQLEVALKKHMSDRTNWQRMLKNQLATDIDLLEEKKRARSLLPEDLRQYIIDDDTITEIAYPVEAYPKKVKSISFDKTADYTGKLQGIKGQYLLFEDGQVLNIRKHNGYKVEIAI